MKTYPKIFRIPISILILAAGLAVIWISKLPAGTSLSGHLEEAQVGFFAPDFELDRIDSGTVKLSSLRGKPVILNFWASWCPPCKAEMPAFQTAHLEYSSTGLQIIAVNSTSQDSLLDVEQFIQQYGITFPIPLDITGSTSQKYLIHSLPTTYFIDKNGIIKDIIIGGPLPLSLLRIQADQLLSE